MYLFSLQMEGVVSFGSLVKSEGYVAIYKIFVKHFLEVELQICCTCVWC